MLSEDIIFTCVTAEKAKKGTWGYFCNDVEHLKKAIAKNRVNTYAFYDQLEEVLPSNEPKRFAAADSGAIFALFCPMDLYYNEKRY